MTILNKEEIDEIRNRLESYKNIADLNYMGLPVKILILNLIDTITDKDKQIQDLQAKVVGLEGQVILLIGGNACQHKPTCSKNLPSMVNGTNFNRKCTCETVKEPEAELEYYIYCNDCGVELIRDKDYAEIYKYSSINNADYYKHKKNGHDLICGKGEPR